MYSHDQPVQSEVDISSVKFISTHIVWRASELVFNKFQYFCDAFGDGILLVPNFDDNSHLVTLEL